MARSTVHYADNTTNNLLKKLHNKLRPAGTPVRIDLDAIFANPIYGRLLGRFEEINKLFEGRLRDVFAQLSSAFRVSA